MQDGQTVFEYELFPHFQPIVSVVNRKVVGYEGLIRRYDRGSESVIYPRDIFTPYRDISERIWLDRMCRKLCLDTFGKVFGEESDTFLFLNIDTAIIKYVEGSSFLMNQVKAMGIRPQNVVIEIQESQVEDLEILERFVRNYKAKGFLIALDDMGSGFSNFERISSLRPDIIKVDISLVRGIDQCYYKSEIFDCLVRLAVKIGALVIAEGVETTEEAVRCIENGAHFMQGYLFSRPAELTKPNGEIRKVMDEVFGIYKQTMKNKILDDMISRQNLDNRISTLIQKLEETDEVYYGPVLADFLSLAQSFGLEGIFVLDEYGSQVTETFLVADAQNERKNIMFVPAKKGGDYSLKKYYYELMNAGVDSYTSEIYISAATGNSCVTISKVFTTPAGEKRILCVDRALRFE